MRILLFSLTLSLHFGYLSSTSTSEVRIPCPELTGNQNKLLELSKTLRNGTEVVIDCAKIPLKSLILISMIDDLHVTGSNGSTIECEDELIAGIAFTEVTNLVIENLNINNCGSFRTKESFAGINITNSLNVTIRNVGIRYSKGTGLALVNSGGYVTIESCLLEKNGASNFVYNEMIYIKDDYAYAGSNEQQGGMSGGGGVQILLDHARDSHYVINNCTFVDNAATRGGGLFIQCHAPLHGNTIHITHCTFVNNSSPNGGGGVQLIGILNNVNNVSTHGNTSILFHACRFEENRAKSGGGMAIVSTYSKPKISQIDITFSECKWKNNSAIVGLAVDISLAPWEIISGNQVLLLPKFTSNCVFSQNRASKFGNFILNNPRSAMVVTRFTVQFEGMIIFKENEGTAIEAVSTTFDILPNSTMKFIGNNGIKGGALHFRGESIINVHENNQFWFENNTADRDGGAIFLETNDKHILFSSDYCFINNDKVHNVSFTFRNNKADYIVRQINQTKPVPLHYRHRGDSLYTNTILPCIRKCAPITLNTTSFTNALECLGNFSFDESSRPIATTAHHFASLHTTPDTDQMCMLHVNFENKTIQRNPNFDIAKSNPIRRKLMLIPGKNEILPLKLVDEFCGEVFFYVTVRVIKPRETTLFIDTSQITLTDNYIMVQGKTEDNGLIQLSSIGTYDISLQIQVKLDHCPPGYVHERMKCICAAKTQHAYRGIDQCNDTEFRAYVQHGYWVGYASDINESVENSLICALCPRGFCLNETYHLSNHLLPPTSRENISAYICNQNRTGMLCGACKPNHSAYYHSRTFSCKSNELCHLGWLFYILSEIVPVTLLFLMVIFFNIPLTSGALNSVIFFIQVVDNLKIMAESFIPVDDAVQQISKIYKFVYRTFNLSPFALEDLSFCLWPDASALDILTFKYVTILYAFILVVATVVLIRLCNLTKAVNLKGSIIHGLSAFFVMSYSECIRVSLSIIIRSTLRIGPDQHNHNRYVAYYNGEYVYMGAEHLHYAIPAIFSLLLVTIPLILLLCYPLCYKLFTLLKIEESKCVLITCKILPLEKLKPLFDSLQGAFKDEYRFFAGLYFLYRLCALLTFCFATSHETYYTATEIQLVCVLFVHAGCRPYKEGWHNVLDIGMLSNLAIINAITFYNYQISYRFSQNLALIRGLTALQCGLIFIPLIYIAAYAAYRIIKACFTFKFSKTEKCDDSDEILDILDTRSLSHLPQANYALFDTSQQEDNY